MNTDPFLEFGKLQHEYTNRYIEAADRKAGAAFAVTAAVIGYFIEKAAGFRWLDFGNFSMSHVVALAAISTLSYSVFVLFKIFWPRLSGDPKGIIFFQSVASIESADAYAGAILAKTESELRTARLKHCHELARICTEKFKRLEHGMATAFIGVFLFLLVLLMDSFVALGK